MGHICLGSNDDKCFSIYRPNNKIGLEYDGRLRIQVSGWNIQTKKWLIIIRRKDFWWNNYFRYNLKI